MEHDEITRVLLQQRIRLLAYLRAIVADHHLAEDLYQDLAAAAVGKASEINDAEHLQRWLMQAARFRGIDAMRRQQRTPLVLDSALLEQLEPYWTVEGPTSERVDALRACLRELSPYARTLVEHRYVDGFAGEALAAAMGRALNTVYVALSRAHRQLATCVRQRLETLSHG